MTDIEAKRRFYVDVLGCVVGRETERWIDFNFYGHQVSAHLVSETKEQTQTNPVDGKPIPVRHFGLVLDRLYYLKNAASPYQLLAEATFRIS